MDIKLKEIELEWPSEISIFELKNYVLSKLRKHGEPLRWAITSVTTYSEKKGQIISLEVVLIIKQKKEGKSINPALITS